MAATAVAEGGRDYGRGGCLSLDGEEQMIVEVRHALLGAWNVGRALESEREAKIVDGDRFGRIRLVDILPRVQLSRRTAQTVCADGRLSQQVSSSARRRTLVAEGKLSITQCTR